MDIYPKPPEAVDTEPLLSNKPNRRKRLAAASVATLLSAGAVVGVAASEPLRSSRNQVFSVAETAHEFEMRWREQRLIETARAKARWIEYAHNQAVENGLKVAANVAKLAVKIAESQNDYIPSSNSSSSVSDTSYNGNVETFLTCTRAHESDTAGGYQAVSAGGTYRGAYQFDKQTWDSTASNNGRPDLVGKDPAQVAPAAQDEMATELYEERGNQPWGGRC